MTTPSQGILPFQWEYYYGRAGHTDRHPVSLETAS